MRLRGRKGIRENLEQQVDLVVLEPKQHKGKWSELFGNDHPIFVEFGMGKGQFISQMSYKYPEFNFIGIDMYDGWFVVPVRKLVMRGVRLMWRHLRT